MTVVMIILSGLFINNILLAKTQGICPFLGLSNKVESAVGMGIAVTFVITVASAISYLMHDLLVVLKVDAYLDIIVKILVIASLVQIIEIVLKKLSPSLYGAMGIYLPLITTNCAVLAMADVVTVGSLGIAASPNFFHATLTGFSYGAGFLLAIVILAGLRDKIDRNKVAKPFQGFPIALIAAAMMAMAFEAFTGLSF